MEESQLNQQQKQEFILFNEQLRDIPYKNNEEYLMDIIYLIKNKIYVYYAFIIQDNEDGSYTLRNTVIYKADIEKILNQGFSDYEDSLYHEYQIKLKEFFDFIKYRAKLSREQGISIPLDNLIELFKLTHFEIHSLLLSLAVEMNTEFEKVYGFLSDEISITYLTIELSVKSFQISDKERTNFLAYFVCENKLQKYIFIEANRNPNRSILQTQLKLEPHIISYILQGKMNEKELQGEFYHCTTPLPPISFDDNIHNQLMKLWNLDLLLYLYGEKGNGKKYHLKHIAKEENKNIFFLSHDTIQKASYKDLHKIEGICILTNSILAIYDCKSDSENENFTPIFELAENLDRVVAIGEDISLLKPQISKKIWYPFSIEKPNRNQRIQIIKEIIEDMQLDTDIKPNSLLYDFKFNYYQIQNAMIFAKSKCISLEITISEDILIEGFYEQISKDLQNIAVKIGSKFDWKDLILPALVKEKLMLVCNHVKYKNVVYNEWEFGEKWSYGQGVTALFTGAPGTGKTMAAQIIAHELKLHIYKVDLSGLVSKYIGETEKNIEQVFKSAQAGNAILFFDEADALFGKRTEIKDSHDKHANMQTSYLLQKIEEYDGIVLLASNYAGNFDDAYKRRFKLIIDFPFPTKEYRQQIWEFCFPKNAPLEEGIDFEFLSENFELSPGVIKNICLNAGIIAAGKSKPVGMAEIVMALRIEMDKNNQVLLKEDLKEYYDI